MKHTIKLDENKLKKIISESVKNVLQGGKTNLPGPQETDKMINQLAPIRDTFKELGYEEAADNIQQAIYTVIKIKNEYARNLTGYDVEKSDLRDRRISPIASRRHVDDYIDDWSSF